jgi:ketose-bisphosphate aldolase
MFDGSALPYEENVAQTTRFVQLGHAAGVPVEAELGRVLRRGATAVEIEAALTDPAQAADFAARTGCDALAVAVGSIHAMHGQEAELDIERVRAIAGRLAIPLVLHGSSGVKEDSIRAAVEHGVCKVNVATALRQAFVGEIRTVLAENPEEVDFRKLFPPAREAVAALVRAKIRTFGAAGRITPGGHFRSTPTHWPIAGSG